MIAPIHVTVFPNGGEPFMALHINNTLCGLWRGGMIQAAGEVLKELVYHDLATVGIVGPEAQKTWDEIKTATDVFAQLSDPTGV